MRARGPWVLLVLSIGCGARTPAPSRTAAPEPVPSAPAVREGAAPEAAGASEAPRGGSWRTDERGADPSWALGAALIAGGPSGSICAADNYGGTILLGNERLESAGFSDILVACFSPTAEPLWSLRLGDAEDDLLGGAAVDAAGNVTLSMLGGPEAHRVGRVSSLSSTGTPRWSREGVGGAGIAADPGGYFYVAHDVVWGAGPLARDVDGRQVLMTRLAPDGSTRWSVRFPRRALPRGTFVTGEGPSVAWCGDGTIVAAGQYYTARDPEAGGPRWRGSYVIRVTLAGQVAWAKVFGPVGDAGWESHPAVGGSAVACDASGRVTFVGSFSEQVDVGRGPQRPAFSEGGFVAHLTAEGDFHWSNVFRPFPSAVTVDQTGQVWVAGVFTGPLTIGSLRAPGDGGDDLFVARLDDRNGEALGLWSAGHGAHQYGDVPSPAAIAVTADGTPWVLDAHHRGNTERTLRPIAVP